MTNLTLENQKLTVKLSENYHQLAKQFASQQSSKEKVKQVYLNTLTVKVVNDFLQWFNIETDLEAGDSWNPVIRRFNDVADLVIPNLGKIECCPVIESKNQTVFPIPTEAQEDRLAYVFVQFSELLNNCNILGYYSVSNITDQITEISLDQLQAIEELPEYLYELESYDPVLAKVEQQFNDLPRSQIIVFLEKLRKIPSKQRLNYLQKNLSQLTNFGNKLLQDLEIFWGEAINIGAWFDDIWQNNWQPLNNLISTVANYNEKLALRLATDTRSHNPNDAEVIAKRKASYEVILGENKVSLVQKIDKQSDGNHDILLQVYPTGENNYLPPNLDLIILDEKEELFLQATSRANDNWIQLQFQGEENEEFYVQLKLEENTFQEKYIIKLESI
jgi:hypothetical protein